MGNHRLRHLALALWLGNKRNPRSGREITNVEES